MKKENQEVIWAKETAKRLFSKFSYQATELQQYELSSLLGLTYEYLELSKSMFMIDFKPTTNDVKSYGRVLDVNRDGKVTLEDL